MRGERFTRNLGCNFFQQRVVGIWKEMPKTAVKAGTITTHEKHLNRYMNKKG